MLRWVVLEDDVCLSVDVGVASDDMYRAALFVEATTLRRRVLERRRDLVAVEKSMVY